MHAQKKKTFMNSAHPQLTKVNPSAQPQLHPTTDLMPMTAANDQNIYNNIDKNKNQFPVVKDDDQNLMMMGDKQLLQVRSLDPLNPCIKNIITMDTVTSGAQPCDHYWRSMDTVTSGAQPCDHCWR